MDKISSDSLSSSSLQQYIRFKNWKKNGKVQKLFFTPTPRIWQFLMLKLFFRFVVSLNVYSKNF